MPQSNSLLSIRLEGNAIGQGRIGVPHLLRLLGNLNKALARSGQVLQGEADSVRKGPKGKSLKEEIALDLVLLTHGSPATLLGFERHRAQLVIPAVDIGLEILEKALEGLSVVQKPGQVMPAGFDAGVLMAWRDVGILLEQGVSEIRFELNHRDKALTTTLNSAGYNQLQKLIQGPQINIRTIEGRLLMADFKEHGTRCRVHPSVGDPVLCLFDEEQKDEVLEDILHFVRVIGKAKEDPITGRITTIKIHDIQRLEEKEEEQVELLPQGSPIPSDFWQSPTLEQLAEAQGVRPLVDVSVLCGTWPGEMEDGFEESILALRRQSLAGGES